METYGIYRELDERNKLAIVETYVDSWLAVLEKEIAPEKETITKTSLEQYESRSRIFPEGQITVKWEDFAVGSICSLIVQTETVEDLADTMLGLTGNGLFTTHKPNGNTLVCPTVTIHKNYLKHGLGKSLIRKQAELAKRLGMKFLYAYSRPLDYGKFLGENQLTEQQMPVEEYLNIRKDGLAIDRTIGRLHERNGATKRRIIPNGRPSDKGSRGYNVVMEYDLARF